MERRSTPNRLLDAAYQNQLAKRLRGVSEAKAFTAIKRLIGIEPKIGLELSNRVIRSVDLLERLLNDGLPGSNETTVRFWLESLGPRLGIDRTLSAIRSQNDPDRKIASRALYWLPTVFKDDAAARIKIEEFRRSTEATPSNLLAFH
jgi:hypothetical protein